METRNLPMVALRGLVVFPDTLLHFDVGRDKSIKALEASMDTEQLIFLCTQKDIRTEDPEQSDVYPMGVVARIKQILKLPGDNVRVLATGITRALMTVYEDDADMRRATVTFVEEPEIEDKLRAEAQVRTLTSLFERYAGVSGKLSPEILLLMHEIESPGKLCDLIAGNALLKTEDKQRILDATELEERVNALIEIIARETEIAGIEGEITRDVKKQIEKSQREYYLREQMKVIQKELDGGDEDEMAELARRIKETPMSEEAEGKCLKELSRLEKMSSASPESSVIRNYLDWMLSMPWGVTTEDDLDIAHARKVLDADHYGLKDVKERVLEYLAVRKLKNDMHGPILCFVGPPGTGKTSVARSIARALNRKFIRTSLGGVRDEAEIRGHRRTYIGAIPGRVISSMKQAGTMNPVLLFDEIDKMSSDFSGDPASAMLEVLDPETNNTFRDHYLDVGFDLSQVMFVTTANNPDTIPRPLLDRMEMIELSSYMENEKLMIAKRHLLPKQRREHGLTSAMISVSDGAIKKIIEDYTFEAGVRNLERSIAAICRKTALELATGDAKKISVGASALHKYLGVPKNTEDMAVKKPSVGVVNGLAWTAAGGTTLPVEAVMMSGKGEVVLTGSLGEVMQESAQAAIGYIRAHADELNVPHDFHEKNDIHIHCPSGAVPKDGPSAGITMATAVVSALTGKKVRSDIAMTGEITLTGKVLPIGGLKEKSLAAQRAGIKTVIIPRENERDLEDIPADITDKLEFYPVDEVSAVFKKALIAGKTK